MTDSVGFSVRAGMLNSTHLQLLLPLLRLRGGVGVSLFVAVYEHDASVRPFAAGGLLEDAVSAW